MDAADEQEALLWARGPKTLPRPEIKFVGEDADPLMILARCDRAAHKAGWSRLERQTFAKKAMSGSYDYFLSVVVEYFEIDDDYDSA